MKTIWEDTDADTKEAIKATIKHIAQGGDFPVWFRTREEAIKSLQKDLDRLQK